MSDLILGGRAFHSRLFLGTGKFRSNAEMSEAVLASGTEMVTLARKRVELEDAEDDMLRKGIVAVVGFHRALEMGKLTKTAGSHKDCLRREGCLVGFEPTTFRTTI